MTKCSQPDIACICMNGHILTDFVTEQPIDVTPYCEKCGSQTVTACPECNKPIRGGRWVNYSRVSIHTPPRYCWHCGKPYPWTQAALDLIEEFANDDGNVSGLEIVQLKNALPDILADTPRSAHAAKVFRETLAKAGGALRDVMVEFAVKFAAESLRGQLL